MWNPITLIFKYQSVGPSPYIPLEEIDGPARIPRRGIRRKERVVNLFPRPFRPAGLMMVFLLALIDFASGSSIGIASAQTLSSIGVTPADPTVPQGNLQAFTATGTFNNASMQPFSGRMLAAGDNHTCSVMADGTVQCWGANANGQLGDGTTVNSPLPVQVTGITNAVAVSGGSSHTCAVLSDGTMSCWGNNFYGQLGNGTSTGPETCNSQPCSTTPVPVTGLTNAVAVSAGVRHICAVLADGTVACWGQGIYGELGDGNHVDSTTPVQVSGISNALEVAAGYSHSCALLSNGTVKCWGVNSYGELGNGTSSGAYTPVAVTGLSTATSVTAGYFHTCALQSNRRAVCWGSSEYGQLGNGTNTGPDLCTTNPCSMTPDSVSGLSNVIEIAAGSNFTCAILTGGYMKCWGINDLGQLGDGTGTDSTAPKSVSGISGAAAASSGFGHACALLTDGTMKCWGYNQQGQLGDGTGTDAATPVSVSIPPGSVLVTTWTSSDTAVAMVNANGIAAGLSPGTATITAASGAVSGGTTMTVAGPNQSPSAPVLLSPEDEATGLGSKVTFDWEASTDPEGDPIDYRLCIRPDDSDFADTDCEPAQLAAVQDLKDILLAVAGPTGSGILIIGMVLFGGMARRKKLILTVGLLILSGTILVSCGGSGGGGSKKQNGVTVSGLQGGTTYFWKVVAEDDQGGESESEVRSFTTK
jgi:alpha-tubulin suppressor-like RCC1 family protein